MTDLKCTRCGALTVGGEQICRLCGIESNPLSRPFPGPILYPAPQQAAVNTSDITWPTITLFIKNFWLITKLTLVIVVPFEIFKTLSFSSYTHDEQLGMGIFVLDYMCKVLIAPALIYALMKVRETGKAPGINESYRWGVGKLGKLSICAAIAWILQALGFALCIVPGIFAWLALQIVYPIAVLEKGSALEALQKSHDLTTGHRGYIFVANVVIWILILLVTVPIEGIGTGLLLDKPTLWPIQVGTAIFADIIEQWTTVLSLVTYLAIRGLWSEGSQ